MQVSSQVGPVQQPSGAHEWVEPEALHLPTSSQKDRARARQDWVVGVGRRWRMFGRRVVGEGQAQGLYSQSAPRWVGPDPSSATGFRVGRANSLGHGFITV